MSLTVECANCGSAKLSVRGTERYALLLSCKCGTLATVEGLTVISGDGWVMEADAMPEALRPIGQDENDPWVWLRLRMKRSQRQVIRDAMKAVTRVAGKLPGQLTLGTALEWICADFNSGH